MKFLIFISALYLNIFNVLGQTTTQIKINKCNLPSKERTTLSIKRVTIQDTFLVKQIELFIEEEGNRDSLFRSGLGYMEVIADQDLQDGIEHRYYINNEFVSLKDERNDQAFPPFYSYVAGRLVFIYMPVWNGFICYQYSKKSKRKLKRKLEPFLTKAKKLIVRDKNGKVIIRDKQFRVETIKQHGGKYIYIYRNRPPRVVPEIP